VEVNAVDVTTDPAVYPFNLEELYPTIMTQNHPVKLSEGHPYFNICTILSYPIRFTWTESFRNILNFKIVSFLASLVMFLICASRP
jgi:hypothetical protein